MSVRVLFFARIRDELGWEPEVPFDELVSEMVDAALDRIQALRPGCGVPEICVNAIRDRALVGAFLPSSFDLEACRGSWSRSGDSNPGPAHYE